LSKYFFKESKNDSIERILMANIVYIYGYDQKTPRNISQNDGNFWAGCIPSGMDCLYQRGYCWLFVALNFLKMERRIFTKTLTTSIGALTLGSGWGMEGLSHQKKKLGIALVGLGGYATRQLAPALMETQWCSLKGIVTGTPAKAAQWKQQYRLEDQQIYNYENFDSIADNPDIDIVYVVLPNHLHKAFTLRAFAAGKHVICEKPMALNAEEAAEMIAAGKKANRGLFLGYRLHYEPHHRESIRLCETEAFGKIKFFEGGFGFRIGNPNQWRLKKAYGGGALMDVGIYVIQGARYTIGEEPVAVTAQEFKTDPVKFKEVDEVITWQMEFPGGAVANCTTSFSAGTNHLYVGAEKGFIRLSPAYTYGGLGGYNREKTLDFPEVNQQALHMDGISNHLIHGVPHLNVGGDEGLQDMKIIDAIFASIAQQGKRVDIS
jgi:predicted dehydrogenase